MSKLSLLSRGTILLLISNPASAAGIAWRGAANAVPLGGTMTVLLGLALLAMAYWFFAHKDNSHFRHMAIAALTAGALSAGFGGKIIGEAVANYQMGHEIHITRASGEAPLCPGQNQVYNNYSHDVGLTKIDLTPDAILPNECDGYATPPANNVPENIGYTECTTGMTLTPGDICVIYLEEG